MFEHKMTLTIEDLNNLDLTTLGNIVEVIFSHEASTGIQIVDILECITDDLIDNEDNPDWFRESDENNERLLWCVKRLRILAQKIEEGVTEFKGRKPTTANSDQSTPEATPD